MFSPSNFSVKSGAKITIVNTAISTSHTFTIDGTNISITNSPRQSQAVTIKLPPGTYRFHCIFHVALGMKGTLTVT